jgi:hypothetical protein
MNACKKLALVFAILCSVNAMALPTSVLSNLNQPSQGAFFRVGVLDRLAIPFTTDSNFTEFNGVELSAYTLYAPGLFFVEIWDVDVFGQPGNVVQVLSGPAAPAGLVTYTSNFSLQALTSYFVVIGTRNGGSETRVYVKDNNLADTTPPPIYAMGTDVNGDDVVDLVKKCEGSLSGLGDVSWQCAGPSSTLFFPQFRLLAEEPAPPVTYSLTASPLFLDFGIVPAGTTSSALAVSIINDGSASQLLGSLSISSRFNIVADSCSTTPLAAAASCIVTISFSPDHGGVTSGTLIIPADAADSRSPYGLILSGQSDGTIIELPKAGQAVKSVPTLRTAHLILLSGLLIIAVAIRRKVTVLG